MLNKFSSIFLLSTLLLVTILNPIYATSYDQLRQAMVTEQIKARGVNTQSVLSAMTKVARHLFVPDNEMKHAYQDRPLPIGSGQTISQPYIVALMTDLLDLDKHDNVLEIGTGSGYQAAILGQIVNDVYTIEIFESLSKAATTLFKQQNYKNINTLHADGYDGWEAHAPYDAIIVTCAPSFVPPPLIKQLKVGGLMVIPVGPPFTVQKLLLIKKVSKDKVKTKVITDVVFVPLVRKTQ